MSKKASNSTGNQNVPYDGVSKVGDLDIAKKAKIQKKRLWIEIPQFDFDKFEQIRLQAEKPLNKIQFYTQVYKNGVTATNTLITQQQTTPTPKEAISSPIEKIVEKEKIVYKIPLWAKIVGGLAGLGVVLLLIFRPRYEY